MNSNTEANVTVEIPFRTEKAHANPFLDLTPQDWVLVLEKS